MHVFYTEKALNTKCVPKVRTVGLYLNVGVPEHCLLYVAPSNVYLIRDCNYYFDSITVS